MKIDTDKLVQGEALLTELFPNPKARPCLRTLRNWQYSKKVPYFKIGHLVFFDPVKVRQSLERHNLIKPLVVNGTR